MKDYYKISEISKLYGIGVDSLRYYEKIGAIQPKRGQNGYRYYSLKDIYRLNVIRDLLPLGFSMEQITEYLEKQNMEKTTCLLEEALEEIQAQLSRLEEMGSYIAQRLEAIRGFREVRTEEFVIKAFPNRPCIRLDEEVTKDEEVDFLIKKLHRTHEKKIRNLSNYTRGACLALGDYKKEIYHLYRSVFFILDKGVEVDFTIPGGSYLTFSYYGDYSQSPQRILNMMDFAEKQGFELSQNILELYLIDNRYTQNTEEYLTEIQIRIL